jgi:uncharacterized membrane protein
MRRTFLTGHAASGAQHPHRLFQAGVGIKGLQALIEAGCGALLLFLDNATIKHVVRVVTQIELDRDPREAIAAYLLKLSQGFSIGSQHFYALYFLLHGAVKLLLVAALLRNRPWSYPAALVMLSLFLLYPAARLAQDWSWPLALLTSIDIGVIAVIYWQYRSVRPVRTA